MCRLSGLFVLVVSFTSVVCTSLTYYVLGMSHQLKKQKENINYLWSYKTNTSST